MLTATAIIAAALLAAAAAPQAREGQDLYLHRLFRQYDQWERREFPDEAMRRGDYTNADRLTDMSLDAFEARHRQRAEFLKQLRGIDPKLLGEEDLVSYELFETMLSNAIDGHRFRTFLAPLGSRSGPHQEIAQMCDHVRFESEKDYANYVTRLELAPQLVRQSIALMERGIEESRVPPKVVLEGVPEQIRGLIDGGLDRLRGPLEQMPETIDPERRDAILQGFERTQAPLRDTLGELHEFVVERYVPSCRDSIAAADWPEGDLFYAHRLRTMTTTDLTAQEIHELGLAEVARIRGEMLEVIRRSDFLELHPEASSLGDDELLSRFLDYLRTDPRFYHESAEALLDGYRAICKEVDGHMPRLFGLLPRLPYGVRAVPAFMEQRQTTAYYMSGDLRNAEAGFFYANTWALDQRPKYEMIPLALHEAVPGHHHQIAIAKELEDLPEFRRELWFTAYGEGWALYAERLGIEMGFFEDPYDDFGRLLYEMWRACRLVVDPGMHALGWPRQQAIDFMLGNTALSRLNIINEIDRYIAWPGQATAYKIGELKIRELRERAETTLGEHFDLRAFHDTLLSAGSIPLPVLERRVDAWIRSVQMGRIVYD